MVKKLEIKFPKDKNKLKNMIRQYRNTILNDRVEKKEMGLPNLEDNADYKLDEKIQNIISQIDTSVPYLRRKTAIVKDLMKTDSNLSNMDEFYKKQSDKLENEFNNIKDTEDVNKRLVDFYNKDYDSKIFFKKYLKYIYNFLIFILILILLYKNLHKNKKILLFLAFLMVIPAFLLRILFDSIMKYIGHFKLDVLYSFFMIISVSIGCGGFLIVKKLLKMLQKNENTVKNTVENTVKNTVENTVEKK